MQDCPDYSVTNYQQMHSFYLSQIHSRTFTFLLLHQQVRSLNCTLLFPEYFCPKYPHFYLQTKGRHQWPWFPSQTFLSSCDRCSRCLSLEHFVRVLQITCRTQIRDITSRRRKRLHGKHNTLPLCAYFQWLKMLKRIRGPLLFVSQETDTHICHTNPSSHRWPCYTPMWFVHFGIRQISFPLWGCQSLTVALNYHIQGCALHAQAWRSRTSD